jgi:hypothetical protein
VAKFGWWEVAGGGKFSRWEGFWLLGGSFFFWVRMLLHSWEFVKVFKSQRVRKKKQVRISRSSLGES